MTLTEAPPQPAVSSGSVAPITQRRRHAVDRGMVAALLLGLVALGPLSYPGFFYNHRGLFSAYELVGLAVRPAVSWLPSLADGPSLAEGPLPFWIGRLVLLLGVAPTVALKAAFGLGLLLAVVGTYVCARRLGREPALTDEEVGWVDWSALAAAAAIVTMPALLGAVYVRGDLAEVWAFGLLPWAVWAAHASDRTALASRDVDVFALLAGALLWAALGLSNVGILLAAFVLLAATWPGRASWGAPVGGALIATAAWTLIAARQRIDLALDQVVPVDPAQLFAPFGSDALTPREGLLIGLGAIPALAFVLGWAPLGFRNPRGLLLFAAGVVALIGPWASPVWAVLPKVLNQPNQLVLPAGLALALAMGLIVLLSGLGRPATAGALVALALATGYPNLRIQPVVPREPVVLNPIPVDRDVVLLEATLAGSEPRPGGRFAVTLVWQTRNPIGRNLTVFTHVVDGAGQVVAQHDGPPVGGLRPTAGWRIGETFIDEHRIPLQSDLPAGRYRVVAGMYEPATGNRVDVRWGSQIQDHVVIAEVEIR